LTIFFKYSDILLMAAEIANDPACGTRDEAFAKKCLLEVRKRAYKGNESLAQTYVDGLSGQDAIFNAIVDERALEFVGEMLRKQDLIRWNMLKTKIDEAKADMTEYFARTGEYADFGPAVWYRTKEDGSLELYGYDQPADGDTAPAGEGWVLHKDKYFYYLTKEKDEKG
jgi:hypothetical protein